MWLPKAIKEEGEDLIGKPGKPHPEDTCRMKPRSREENPYSYPPHPDLVVTIIQKLTTFA